MKKTPYDDFDVDFDDNDDEQNEETEKKRQNLKEFSDLLEESFSQPERKIAVGDKIRCQLLTIGGDVAFLYVESGGIPLECTISKRELLNAEGNLEHKQGDFLDLYVTKIRGRKISLSKVASTTQKVEDFSEAFSQGLPIEGRVTEVCKGGVRVSLRGKSAFCPISQLDLERVETGENFVGQKLEFLITQISEGGRNIVVSRRKLLQSQKQLSQESFSRERKDGDFVTGKIKRIEPFGAFVEIAPGVEGLLHISEMSWSRVNDPHEVLTLGQEVRVKILGSEKKDNRLRISLSLKQAQAEPWEDFPEHLKEGRVVDGKVVRCLKFGAFVELDPGIEGLIPLSEMSYKKRVVRSDEMFQEGDRIAVMIKEIHPESKKILLSLKDAGADPWALVPQKFPLASVAAGKVVRREPYGIFVELEEGITGLLPKSKAQANPEFPFEKIKNGDTVTVQIDEVNMDERRISLNVPQDPDQHDWKKHMAEKAKGSAPSAKLAEKFKNIVIKKNS